MRAPAAPVLTHSLQGDIEQVSFSSHVFKIMVEKETYFNYLVFFASFFKTYIMFENLFHFENNVIPSINSLLI